ncbi:MAG: class I SAM-dependent methyltransferase, partial [Desulfovibrio piger]|uniref:class I SAM-dependent methyltransferase n=2 Tax=Desulfovibrionaceae TaxID=194924 RepID=UPI00399B7F86
MDIWQHIIRPGDVWGRFTLYLKQNGQAAVQREVVRSLRLRVRDVVLDLGGGGRALAQLALYSGAVYGVAATAAAVSAATVRNRHDVARGRVRICRGAFPALPFPAEMFHVITAFEPAFWAGDLSACLREIRRLLRPGGQCVLVCADGRENGRPAPAGHTVDELNALADRA